MNAQNFTIENAEISFRNFSGKAGKINPAGVRNFLLFLDSDFAKFLEGQDAWNIKWLPPTKEYDEPRACLPVEVSFKNPERFPVKIVQITRGGKTRLTEKSIKNLDSAAITNIDLTVKPSYWNLNGKSGIKAYLKDLFVTLAEDELEAKYADLPDRPDSAYNAPPQEDAD
jgi:hypothetical protein